MTLSTAYLLYAVFALGGVSIYFLLPKSGRSSTTMGAVLGLSAVAAFLAILGVRIILPDATRFFFYLFSAVAIVAAAKVITHRRPVYSALYFVLVVVSVAALLVLQGAEFVAIALIIIYAGAIMVVYLFVIMLAQEAGSPIYDRQAREPFFGALAGFVLMAAIAGQAVDLPEPAAHAAISVSTYTTESSTQPASTGNTMAMGATIMTQYIVAVEISGVLLLVAMVGAIAMARKRVPAEGYRPAPRPLGQIGKEVEPF